MTDNTAAATTAATADSATSAQTNDQVLGDWKATIPEKFRTADGALNQEAITKSYLHLEKMKPIKPPDNADGYKWKDTETLKIEEADLKQFRERAFKMGLSQSQFEAVAGEWFPEVGKLQSSLRAELLGDPKTVRETLDKEWGDKAKDNYALANKAWEQLADDSMAGLENHPGVIRLMAKLGAQMGEDKGAGQGAAPITKTLDELLTHAAYLNPMHAEHEVIKSQVNALFSQGKRPSFIK